MAAPRCSLRAPSGLLTTILGINAGVFFRPSRSLSLWSYELWMFGAHAVFVVGLAAFFFFVYGRTRRRSRSA